METEDKFKKSPIHDKWGILEMMDKLNPKEMAKVVEFIQEQVDISCNTSFKEQMVNDIIPFVEKMIEKEKQHLYWLEIKHAPKEFIEKSKIHLNNFEQRHKEYIDYATSL